MENQAQLWLAQLSKYEISAIATAIVVVLSFLVKILFFRKKKVADVIPSQGLKKGFASSRGKFWGKISSILGSNNLSQDLLEEVEELLYGADMGPRLTEELIGKLQDAKSKDQDFKSFFYDLIRQKMEPVQKDIDPALFAPQGKKLVTIMVVGINGAGKTTTIGKLATKLTQQGAKVVVGACDTFRAAAVDQLQVWCDRSGATMVRAKEGANPSGVAYEALQTAQNQKADYCILDTAGRLHTKQNLMKELSKTRQVLQKLDSKAPTHTLLVLDAVTGQNALRQAGEFNQELGVTGLVFTKCDGSSKAGAAIPIVESLQVPITYIGVGEGVEDLKVFSLDEYLSALLDVD